VLASFYTKLKGLLSRLVADPQRAIFVLSVAEKLILHYSSREEDLSKLGSAILQGRPAYVIIPLSRLIASKMAGRLEQGSA
jgi:hypothetical protein